MKKFFLKLLLPVLATTSMTAASSSCNWLDCDWINGEVFAYADYLYWNLRRSGLDYANPTLTGEVAVGDGSCLKMTTPGFNSAYRIGAGYLSNCQWGMDINYTFYTTADESRFAPGTGMGFIPTRGDPGAVNLVQPGVAAQMGYSVSYKLLDARFNYEIATCCYGIFRPYLGGRFAWISERASTDYIGSNTGSFYFITDTTSTHAYGLISGLDYSNLFWCNRFGIFAQFGAGVLFADVEAETFQVQAPVGAGRISFKVCDHRLVSTLDLAFGFEGNILCFCGFNLDGRIGYEFHQWLNMVDFINLTGNVVTTMARNTACFGLDGLVIRLKGSF